MSTRPRLLLLITEDWYFWSHRLDVARAARDAGFDVMIATRVTDHGERIQREGFRLFPISLVRQSGNPFVELVAVLELVRLYRRERPAIVHHVALKPILYGSLAVGQERADSDLDLAVDAVHRLTTGEKLALVNELAERAGRPVDLVDLYAVGEPLLGQILRHGKRLLGSETCYADLIRKHLKYLRRKVTTQVDRLKAFSLQPSHCY